jgi:hypothetical protein
MFVAATLVAASVLALVHVCVGKLRFLDKNPGVWNSAAGGVGIAYAFLVLLPKLASAQSTLQGVSDSGLYGFFVHHSYLVALVGLTIYYGMDVAVESVLVLPKNRVWRPAVKLLVCIHAGSLSGYYLLVSYLMSEQADRGYMSYVSLCLFAAAMVLHYLTVDRGLRCKYGGIYDRYLRWAFVGASVGGWLLAAVFEIPYTALVLLNSLFAGALIVFTLKEKTPGADRVHFWPFLAGVTLYSLLLILIEATAARSAN